MSWGNRPPVWGNRLPSTGGTARPHNLKAFLIKESENPFRQAWLGNKLSQRDPNQGKDKFIVWLLHGRLIVGISDWHFKLACPIRMKNYMNLTSADSSNDFVHMVTEN